MGQEASVPQNGDDSLEEQARAPPSVPPQARSGRKLISGMFRNHNDHDTSRVAAAGGHLHDTNLVISEHEQVDRAVNEQLAQQRPMPQQQPVVGVMYKKNRTGRGIINSMRNLSLTVRPHKKPPPSTSVVDWEKQWDEDDDSEEDEDNVEEEKEEVLPQHHHLDDTDDGDRKPAAKPTPMHRVASDDGLEWDTGIGSMIEEKVGVAMFEPMLRVLGKGSFGKVRFKRS